MGQSNQMQLAYTPEHHDQTHLSLSCSANFKLLSRRGGQKDDALVAGPGRRAVERGPMMRDDRVAMQSSGGRAYLSIETWAHARANREIPAGNGREGTHQE